MEEADRSSEESEGEPARGMNVRKIATYLDFEVWGRNFEDHLGQLYNQGMVRNCFTWRVVHSTLENCNAIAKSGDIFSTNHNLDPFMALLQLFSSLLVENSEENFFLPLFQFFAGCYRHFTVDPRYAVEQRSCKRSWRIPCLDHQVNLVLTLNCPKSRLPTLTKQFLRMSFNHPARRMSHMATMMKTKRKTRRTARATTTTKVSEVKM